MIQVYMYEKEHNSDIEIGHFLLWKTQCEYNIKLSNINIGRSFTIIEHYS